MRFSARFFSSVRRCSLKPAVLVGIVAATAGALDRLGLHPPVTVDFEKSLRGRARDRHVAEAQERGERRRVDVPEDPVQPQRIDRRVRPELVRQADLVASRPR